MLRGWRCGCKPLKELDRATGKLYVGVNTLERGRWTTSETYLAVDGDAVYGASGGAAVICTKCQDCSWRVWNDK